MSAYAFLKVLYKIFAAVVINYSTLKWRLFLQLCEEWLGILILEISSAPRAILIRTQNLVE